MEVSVVVSCDLEKKKRRRMCLCSRQRSGHNKQKKKKKGRRIHGIGLLWNRKRESACGSSFFLSIYDSSAY